ncbi:hypothetical protein AB0C34_17720 [Nocardia sp. NPDC049220]|uniref:hypothetical protein n=1 Tax=Nocardia sp. NPDC049220 TaxID=3155273 RepID=UPI0033F2DBF9
MAKLGRPRTGVTPKQNVRVPQELWDAAKAEAHLEGRSLADVINTDLNRYVARRRRRERGVFDQPPEAGNLSAS